MAFTPNLTLLKPLARVGVDIPELQALLAFYEGEQAKLITVWPEDSQPLAFASITYLERMKALLLESGKFEPDEIGEIMMHARGYAGGVASGEARKAKTADPPEPDLQPLAAHEGYFQHSTFAEVSAAFKPEQWLQITPAAGKTFSHPRYGAVAFTADRAKRLVDNFKSHVYQEHIPIDAEHETKLSGATGYYRDMRVRPDGAVEAQIELTERGRALMEGGGFRYFSPEFFKQWTDPATGQAYDDVVVGGALTSRPYFKDQHLAPLIAASEYEVFKGGKMPPTIKNYMVDAEGELVLDANGEPQLTAEAKAAIETAAVAASEAAKTEAEKQKAAGVQAFAEQFPEQARQLTEALERSSQLERNARTQRFTDITRGHGGANDGEPWAGETAGHVKMLLTLAETFGEEHETFRDYVTGQNAMAKRLRKSGATSIFSEAGSSERSDGETADEEMTELIAAAQKADPSLTMGEATDRVITANPELYQRYAEELNTRG